MGKPTSPLPGISGSASDPDAVSLHTQPGDRVYDDDVPELQSDDLPPLYSDIDSNDNTNAPLLPSTTNHLSDRVLTAVNGPDDIHKTDANTGDEFFISRLLDQDQGLLEWQIKLSASKPPRPSVRILGTHSQTVQEKGKSQKKTITDFDVVVELTQYLFSDTARGISSWNELRTVENTESTRRGTVLRKRAPGVKRDLEVSSPKPTLTEWCHRYCASPAGIKSFALQRRVTGFDEEKMREKLETLVRGTNYRGKVCITFPVKDQYVQIMNDCKVNRWRTTPWIVWMFYLSFMWLFAWPFLFFRTKKFEVAVAEWPFSIEEADGRKRYVSMSEDHIYNLWGRAVSRAVLDKRQGTLDQEDLIASQTAPEEAFGAVLEGAPRFLREGINAITAVNRQLGWGGDSW